MGVGVGSLGWELGMGAEEGGGGSSGLKFRLSRISYSQNWPSSDYSTKRLAAWDQR